MSADLPLSAAVLNHSLPVLVLRRRPRAASGHHGQGFSIESPPEFRSRADALGKRRGAPKMMDGASGAGPFSQKAGVAAAALMRGAKSARGTGRHARRRRDTSENVEPQPRVRDRSRSGRSRRAARRPRASTRAVAEARCFVESRRWRKIADGVLVE